MEANRHTVPKSHVRDRIVRLQNHLIDLAMDAALIVQHTDLFYFAGTIQQAYLYVPAEGDPLLAVHKHVRRAMRESAVEQVVPAAGAHEIPALLRRNGLPFPKTLGLECDVLPVNLYHSYAEVFKGAILKDISHPIRMLRAVKCEPELLIIQEAAHRADQVALAARNHIREGISEIELAGKVEAEARRLGHQGLVRMRMWGGEMFYGHLMAGPSAAEPSYLASPTGGAGLSGAVAQSASFRPIRRREPILIDYVFAYNGYLADHTRIFAIDGLPEALTDAHHAMLEVQGLLEKEAKPGISAGSLYRLAVDCAARLGYAGQFMGADDNARVKFVGHGIGLELDEYPVLAQDQEMVLQEGMVLAVEPKAVFPGTGVVGIENTHVVTPAGLHRLTRFPDEIVVI